MVNSEFIISHEIHICNWTLKLLLGNTGGDICSKCVICI